MKLNNSIKKQEAAQAEDITMPEVHEDVQEEPKEDLSGLDLSEKIIYWKNKYKKIYQTKIGGEHFIWRRITRKEYSNIALANNPGDVKNKQLDMYDKQYKFCQVAVLYPDNVSDIMDECAGICATLGDEIIYASGFGDLYPTTKEIGDNDDNVIW